MRGDTLTAGISRFHGCCSFSTYMNTECAAIYSLPDYGKELSVRIQLEGINLADLGIIREGYQLGARSRGRLARHENQLLKISSFIFRVKLILKRLVPSCREVTYLISRSMESRLALYERILLCLHTFVCSDCTRYQQQLILIRKVARGLSKCSECEERFFDGHFPDDNS